MGGHDHGDAVKKTSISDEEIRKILIRAKVQVPSESPKFAHSLSSGVLHTSIKGAYNNERARLGPNFNETDRQWRVKYLESQNLHPSEPFEVPELSKVHYNPIRRFYRWPLDQVEKLLCNYMEKHYAITARKLIGGTLIGYFTILTLWYQLNYNVPNWEYKKGFRIFYTREVVLPGDSRWPMPNPRTQSWQHYDLDFHQRKAFRND
ncbi:NADH dehydrogenase (ubiquinone) B17 subunit [Dermatophagoides farinae]|uniref:Nadh:ubiquinone oxidoreductase-like protein n=1 Tax=Dermatophagoides farinae TaxID=6954 RepID=A0A9D4NV29_DERFA|nr:uncharacterized protein LOC124489851 [Dermatophagoides farinae]KAH7638672.1 nadh:ubiquinone oxidoreductase-like protein [Dermatophagoides farinae]